MKVKYDYSLILVDYPDEKQLQWKDKIRIICFSHGEFTRTYKSHKHNKIGCPFCSGKVPNGYWTKERCEEDSKKYENKSIWRSESPTAYNIAKKNKWLDVFCSHMIPLKKLNGYWTKEKCVDEAKKYLTITEWGKKSGGSYKASLKYGWVKLCSTHMKNGHRIHGDSITYWTKNKCIADARKYKQRTEWRSKSTAYEAAYKKGWLAECCKHMKRGKL